MTLPTDSAAPLIWCNLLHLSYNMWSDTASNDPASAHDQKPQIVSQPYLRFDMGLWHDLTAQMSASGMNMVLVDVGDGIQFDSHPSISVQGAWSREQLKNELVRLRNLGLEPIPKLNFSTAHDTWLGPYSRMVSTSIYYDVCRDLIAEVCELFDSPRFFHIGMDEETAEHQKFYEYCVVRQGDLWWRDLYFYIEEVERTGARAWMWSDYLWNHPELFFRKMPKSVVQSNWYYSRRFDFTCDDRNFDAISLNAYRELEAHGFDQIPTGSNWACTGNFESTVNFCRQHIAPERLLGFLTAPWHPTQEPFRDNHTIAIKEVEQAKAQMEALS